MRLKLSFFLLLSWVGLQAQTTWQKTYGVSSLAQAPFILGTFDGNYAFTGQVNEKGIPLFKISGHGDTLWTKYYGIPGDAGAVIQQTKDSGFIIAGYTSINNPGNNNLYLVRTNKKGDTLWTRNYKTAGASNYATCIQQTFDGGYIICGQMVLVHGINQTIATLIKTNAVGDTLWTKDWTELNNAAYWVSQTSDSGYIMVVPSSLVVKTKPNGDTLWTKKLSSSVSTLYSVIESADGNYIITGNGSTGAYLAKIDPLGNMLWSKMYNGAGTVPSTVSVQQTKDGGYILAGSVDTTGIRSGYLMKTDALGDSLWSRTFYSGSGEMEFDCVKPTSDKGYIVCGDSNNVTYMYVLKTDSLGYAAGINKPSAIQNIGMASAFSTYPNPSSGKFNIKPPVACNAFSITVYDILGEPIYATAFNNNHVDFTVDLEALPNGIYLYRILAENSCLAGTGKLVIQK